MTTPPTTSPPWPIQTGQITLMVGASFVVTVRLRNDTHRIHRLAAPGATTNLFRSDPPLARHCLT